LRRKLAELIEIADKRLFSEKAFRAELSDWMRSPNSSERDGVPGRVVGLSGPQASFAPWLVKRVNLGKAAGREDLERVEAAPALGVLITKSDQMGDWMDAGQALSAVLLKACYDGLACELYDQPLELPGLRHEIRLDMPNKCYPQAILRVTTAPPGHPLPRRPIESFLEPPADTAPKA